ncbi:hypothetical protein EF910_39175, partial [Streptomyces sp. WAC07149]
YRPDPVEGLLSYPDFVKVLLDWVAWWNTEHHPAGLDANLTPLGCAICPVPAWARGFLHAAAQFARLTDAACLLAAPADRPALLR